MALKRFFAFINRPKVVVGLILAALASTLVGVLLPQTGDRSASYFEMWKLRSPQIYLLANSLQLTHVYTSVWFAALVLLLLLALGHTIFAQARRNIRMISGTARAGAPAALNYGGILRVMAKKRYRLRGYANDGGMLVFAKNRLGIWGGVIFHSGLLLIIIAALMTAAFQQRGFAQIVEGETFLGNDSGFMTKTLGFFEHRIDAGFRTHLSALNSSYQGGDIKSLGSSVILFKGDNDVARDVSVESPVDFQGVRIYQSYNYGYALLVRLKDPSGQETRKALLLDKPDRLGEPARGRFTFSYTGYVLDVDFYPGGAKPSFKLSLPAMYLRVSKNSKGLFQGMVVPGEQLKIGSDVLQFVGARYWSGLIFARNYGADLAYAGFLIAIAGLLLMYCLPYKGIRIRQSDGRANSVEGSARQYPAEFRQELEGIKKELFEANE